MTSFLCALAWTACFALQAEARDLYVSPNGDGTTAITWKTAWKSFQAIDWTQVVVGDRIIVDGGTAGITYTGQFTVPVSGIVIQQAGGINRRGKVTITGSSPPVQSGVTISGSNVRIVGNTRSGITIKSFGGECVRVLTNGNTFKNVLIGPVTGFPPYAGGKVGGLLFGGVNNQFISCDFRDVFKCAVESPNAGGANLTVFRDCTFGNDGYGFWGVWGTGIYGLRPGATTVDSTIHARKCVFGPMLNKGIDVVQGRLNVGDTLFLGANYANLSFEPAVGAIAKAVVDNCTFYEPNFSGQTPYGMLLYNISTNGNGVLKVRDSIVYGGVVHVPATQVINGGGNFQYHVTGNTTALAAGLVDPQFTAEAQLWAPITPTTISPRVWTTQSYALNTASPANGKGSSITLVTDIVPAYGPVHRLPPLGGP
ncbi:MAG: hypothetical protein SGJ27_21780 [Candidatus Melainabacteria bacterium]|nr:hypothetical protein [Candidatus Melainabacteria bacterium]